MNKERIAKWHPDSALPRNLDTVSLTTDFESGVRLILVEPRADGRAFRVEFEKPLAFRSAKECYRLELVEKLTELPWPTFKVEDSVWVEWFHDQTHGAYRDWQIEHFVFLGEEVVEVLSHVQPRFTEIKRPSSFRWR
ncbi:MAG: hypothetical protein LAQ69_48080 [Acidobacteriia bacterium]|nr:hypothetical protein [Terriglobia bacterium]